MQNKNMDAGQVGLGDDIFSIICGTFLSLEVPDVWCNLGHWSFGYRYLEYRHA